MTFPKCKLNLFTFALCYRYLLYSTQLLSFRRLLEFSQNVRLAKQKGIVVAQLDFGSTVFRQENLVTNGQRVLVHGSRHIGHSGSDCNNLTLVGILGGIGGQNNAAGGCRFLGGALDQYSVGEGLQFAKDGLFGDGFL